MNPYKTMRRAAALVGLVALAVGCAKIRALTAPLPQRGNADFGRYVALGTNLSAGFQSGGLAARHQVMSFPNLFARQAGSARFSYPAVNLGPLPPSPTGGWPPLLRVRSFGPPLVIDSAGVRGVWITPLISPPALLDSAYANMSIPGALLQDLNDPSFNYNILLGRDVSFFYNIARQQGRPLPLTILQLVKSRRPTFVTLEYGLNEVLGPASRGSGVPVLTAGQWTGLLHTTLDSVDINLPTATKVIFTIPDVTLAPFFTTIPPYELQKNGRTPVISGGLPKTLLGSGGPLRPDDLITLQAGRFLADTNAFGYAIGDSSYYSGVGRNGRGLPLPDAVVLTASERAAIQQAVRDYNSAILNEAAARGYLVLDLNALWGAYFVSGFRFAGVQYSYRYLSGGMFSVDGLHPTDLYHGLLCNALIELVNRRFGAGIPTLDLSLTMTPSSSAVVRARDEGPPGAPIGGIPLGSLFADSP